jgi:hypothetical protein
MATVADLGFRARGLHLARDNLILGPMASSLIVDHCVHSTARQKLHSLPEAEAIPRACLRIFVPSIPFPSYLVMHDLERLAPGGMTTNIGVIPPGLLRYTTGGFLSWPIEQHDSVGWDIMQQRCQY